MSGKGSNLKKQNSTGSFFFRSKKSPVISSPSSTLIGSNSQSPPSVAQNLPQPQQQSVQAIPAPTPIQSIPPPASLSVSAIPAQSLPSKMISPTANIVDNYFPQAPKIPPPRLLQHPHYATLPRKKQVVAVRLSLPRNISTMMMVDDKTRVEDLVERSVDKLRMMGIEVEPKVVKVFEDETLLETRKLVLGLSGSFRVEIEGMEDDDDTESVSILNQQQQNELIFEPDNYDSLERSTTQQLKDLKLTSKSIHTKKFQVSKYDVEFRFKNDVIKLNVSGDLTIEQVKELAFENGVLAGEEMNEYTLKYQKENQLVELFDEQQIFHTLSVLKINKKVQLVIVEKQKLVSKQIQVINKKIGSIIGYGLYRFDYLRDQEVDIFRRKMVSVRQEALQKRSEFYHYRLELETTKVSKELIEKYQNKIQYRLFYNDEVMKTLTCTFDDTAQAIINGYLQKIKFMNPDNGEFCLKLQGFKEYFMGNHLFADFSSIRRLLQKEEKINLQLINIKDTDVASTVSHQSYEEFDVIEDPTLNQGSHQQLTIEGRQEDQINYISLWDITRQFRIQINACENLNVGAIESIYVEVGLYHGGRLLCPPLKTHQVHATRNPRWGAWLNFDICCYNLPRATRMCLTVWGRWNAKKKLNQDKENDVYPLGWINYLLMDYKGYMKTGMVKLQLWPGEKANPIGTLVSLQNFDEASVFLRLDSFPHPVVYPTETFSDEQNTLNRKQDIPTNFREKIEQAVISDPLYRLDDSTQKMLWQFRYQLVSRPEALAKVLLSCRWEMLDDVLEIKRLLKLWAPLSPLAALELLDANYADSDVRSYAISRLDLLTDDQVLDYLLQLVQALKYESYLDCALARFLLKRALRNKQVGHYLFWYLKSEMEDPTVSLRFALLLEGYLRGCDCMEEFQRQTDLLVKMGDVALTIKRLKSQVERKDYLQQELPRISLPTTFQLALDPKMEGKGLVVEKCKYMDSKKLPLWLVFENADDHGTPMYVIYKSGDDLRQDMLTLQMIRLMDKLWLNENLDLRMTPYGCLATGNGVGMIQVVLNSETVSSIQIAYGGSTAAFRDQPLAEWLRKQNPSDAEYQKAVDTFTLSCAGYCVATYVLGIGDRHNDNIMVTKDGKLFHIDFGHFLGNIKKKFGIKRERAPFVLTPDFVFVMGDKFDMFVENCVKAYLILRKYSNTFINCFNMMLSTGIPELKSVDDIQYLREALCLGKTEEQAAQEFRALIFESLRLGWSTQLNWWLHNLVHSK